jgi:hypothetical protein
MPAEYRGPSRRMLGGEFPEQRLQAAGADRPVHQAERQALSVEVPAQAIEAAALPRLQGAGDLHGYALGRREAAGGEAGFRLRLVRLRFGFIRFPFGIASVAKLVETIG